MAKRRKNKSVRVDIQEVSSSRGTEVTPLSRNEIMSEDDFNSAASDSGLRTLESHSGSYTLGSELSYSALGSLATKVDSSSATEDQTHQVFEEMHDIDVVYVQPQIHTANN